jgi:hypothetical protein
MKNLILSVLMMLSAVNIFAQEKTRNNPIIDGVGLTDPHVFVHDGKAYLFATHDFSPDNKGFVMKDWWLWESKNLVDWKQICLLKPENTFLARPFNDCWATFGVVKNNRWYWYFSAGPTEIGVVTAKNPAGKWEDPLGKPLVPNGLTPTEQRDPDIFIDDDGTAYMVYGTFRYFIVKLNDDMISLAENPRRIRIDRQFGPYGEGKTDDKPSFHKYGGKYYLSWCGFYAMSDSIFGTYQYKGALFSPDNIAPDFFHNDYQMDRHGNIFTFNGQWYYTFNDYSQAGRTPHFRDACITYLHYLDNGEIAPVVLDSVGVGQYDARAGIEAETYFKVENAEKHQCPEGGFEMRCLRDGSVLEYPNVRNLPANARVSFRYSSLNKGGATIEIYDRRPDGKLLGACILPETKSWNIYQTAFCNLENNFGTTDIVLIVRGEGDELLRLNKINFEKN